MEGKDKKKESIDEILSDLNGLLNKMPSILDGIKMPELQPMEAPRPQPVPEEPPAVPAEPPPADADKTIILQPFAGLPEGAPEPEPAVEAAPEAAPAEAAQEPAEGLAPQSLGDFMFGPGAAQEPPAAAKLSGSALEPPEEKAQPAPQPKGPSLSISEFTPPEEKKPSPQASLPAYENTRDFGIPDIDALIQLSEGGAAPAPQPSAEPLPEAGVIPSDVQAIEESKDAPSIQGLSEPTQAEVTSVENNEPFKEESPAGQPEAAPAQEEPQPAPQEAAPSAFDAFAIDAAPQEQPAAEATAAPELSPAAEPAGEMLRLDAPTGMPSGDAGGETLRLDAPADMPSGDAGGETLRLDAPADMPSGDAGGETLRLDAPAGMPSGDAGGETLRLDAPAGMPSGDAGGETLRLDAAPEAAPAPEGGLTLEPQAAQQSPDAGQFGSFPGLVEPSAEAAAAPAAEPAPESPAPQPGGLELSPAVDLSAAPAAEVPAGPSGADETLPGGGGLELSVGKPSGEETLVVAPPSASSGDEEKTVIFQAAPSTTSRAQAGDLDGLASRTAPEGVPAERQRSLMFLYSMEDKALCATVLAELDAICLKSATKPMFIRRAAVKECEPDVNPNFLQQSAADSGAQGLVCLGNIPPDKVSEIESVFSSGNGFFRYYDSSSFNHSAALDLVTDLIVR